MGGRRHRLFVAVWPPSDVVAELGRLPRADAAGVRWVPPEQWHVTLRFLGDAAPEDVSGALRSAPLPAATAVLGPRVARLGRSVVVVPVTGLDELGDEVVRRTADLGRPPDPRGFRGHLTVARLRGRAACGVAGAAVATSFVVGEVTVVSSTTDAAGPTYQVLDRVPVPPAPPTGNA